MTSEAHALARTIWLQSVASVMLFATWPAAFAAEFRAADARRDRAERLQVAQRQHMQGRR